jgi:Leucine-rich repeat (LRR) protein
VKLLPSIEVISCIGNREIEDNGLITLVGVKSLRLYLSGYGPVTTNCMRDMTGLTDLVIQGKGDIDLDLFHNYRINNLRRLKLVSSRMRLGDVYNFAVSLSNLTELGIQGNKVITDQLIQMLPTLASLHIPNNTIITHESVGRLVNLVDLDIGGDSMIMDHHLKEMINLTRLGLSSNVNITNDGLRELTRLEYLSLYTNTKITDDGIVGLTRLEELDVGHSLITNIGIIGLTNITTLHISMTSKITNVDTLTQLVNLYARGNKRMSDEYLKLLTSQGVTVHKSVIPHIYEMW